MKESYTLWEMICGIPAMHAEYDRQDRLERIARRGDHLRAQNDYAQFYEEFLLVLDRKDITTGVADISTI